MTLPPCDSLCTHGCHQRRAEQLLRVDSHRYWRRKKLVGEEIPDEAESVRAHLQREGVESAEMLETSRKLGVDYAQGWYVEASEPA